MHGLESLASNQMKSLNLANTRFRWFFWFLQSSLQNNASQKHSQKNKQEQELLIGAFG